MVVVAPNITAGPNGVTARYTALDWVRTLRHGCGLSGGRIRGGPPSWPAAAFVAMLRSGRRPDGSTVSPVMPFGSLRQMSDVDARALYAYLKSVPARAAGQL